MKTLLYILCLSFMLTGCGQQDLPDTDPVIMADIEVLKANFQKATGRELIVSTPIAFKQLEGANGICENNKVIYIDPDFYEQNKDHQDRRLAVLLHEIGHCTYSLDHNHHNQYRQRSDGRGFIAISVMNNDSGLPTVAKNMDLAYENFLEQVLAN